ncbi:hypothetical protein B0H65DRAFT_505902 [Neurospora tetraspora]|uniref:Uncharacterized protein n=1 Tax=Neurospora tetraspora TaxID=94610 RepID=A0AAE0MXN8_9PEZI|nr:hypothetical protein B0H65DRAFT_505902 [Neurospora tetraspora]
MCRKLWPVYSCGHEQLPAQNTRTESCGNNCPEYSRGSGYYELPTDCGNVRCSTAIRRMFDKGQVKIADWKWNYGAHAGSSYGGGSSSGMGYDAGGGSDAGYGGYGGFAPIPSGPSMSCPVHGGYNSAGVPLMPPFLQPYPNAGGGGGYYQGYNNPMLRPMSAPPAPFFGQPFFPPFPAFGGGGRGCPPPPPPRIVVRYRR